MALGKGWRQSGLGLAGFVGRSEAAAAAAVRFCGGGEVLRPADLGRGHVVVFAVGDDDLAAAIAGCAAAATPLRACSLWLHTSGRHGLEVFASLQQQPVRRGALHPVCPFPDAEQGLRNLAGQPAVLLDGGGAARLLRRLCTALSMLPMPALPSGDRALYHAACALAANGATALFAAVEQLLQTAAVLPADSTRLLTSLLMQSAVGSAAALGPGAALSGPVLRGDVATVAAHLEVLRRRRPDAVPVYLALQRLALPLAVARGLPPAPAAALQQLLQEGP